MYATTALRPSLSPDATSVSLAKLLGEIADTRGFRIETKLATYAGVAAIPVSSGRSTRVRLNRRGNTQLNFAIHRIAVTQLACHPPARDHVQRRRARGNSTTEALRALKRHIVWSVYTTLVQAAEQSP